MKREISLTIFIFLIFIISIVLMYSKKDKEIINTNEENKNGMLSIMVESETGTGNYKDASSFPSTGYYLNKKLSKCVNGSKISFSEGNLIIKGNKTDRCYAYFDKDELGSICKGQNMAECFIKNYQKDASIIYHDVKLEGGAEDLSYRYTGSFEEVKNFVCLDGNATTERACANENSNLYRIIGLFKNEEGKYEAKLIKYDYIAIKELGSNGSYSGSSYSFGNTLYKGNKEKFSEIGGYYWTANNNEANAWMASELRKTNLNTFYLNYLKNTKHLDVDKMITNHSWSFNGYNNNESVTPKVMYNSEMNKNESDSNTSNKVENKIGLMYVSDYGYAARYVVNTGAHGIRPCFYLVSSIILESGNGTMKNPYRLSI